MPSSRLITTVAGAGLSAFLFAGCGGGDSLSEFGLEQLIEAESGEDIDLDLSDGGFSVSTDEGDFSIDFDEDGGFSFDSDDGSGTGTFGEGGITFDTDEGSGTIAFDEDGGVTFDTDEGSGVIGVGKVPADWPSIIGVPDTMAADGSFFSSFAVEGGKQQTAIFEHDPAEPFAAAVVARLQGAGYTLQGDGIAATAQATLLTNGATQILISTEPSGQTVVVITPNQS